MHVKFAKCANMTKNSFKNTVPMGVKKAACTADFELVE